MNKALKREGCEGAVTEIYALVRVNGIAEKLGILPGMSLDLTTLDEDGKPWDFNLREKRERAIKLIRERKAMLLIGSPMCTAFSQIHSTNANRTSPQEF